MKRRDFLKKVGLGTAAVAATAVTAPAVIAQKKYMWKMVTTWPPKLPVLQDGCERLAQRVDEMSGGRLKIQVFAGGELVPPLGGFDAVSQGRKMDRSKVEALADGRIFTGEEAKSLGLVDRLGNMEDAVDWAGRMAGIKGKISTVYAREKKFSFLKDLMTSSLKEVMDGAITPYLYPGFLYLPNQ